MTTTERTKKILIVSSDKNLTNVLNFCFDGWGYEVFIMDSMGSDISPVKRLAPDVIVADIYSANKSHLEICRILKNDLMTALIPVITLINKRQLRTQLLNLRHGVDDYLIKPPDPLDLRVRVEMALRRSQYSLYASPLTGLPGSRVIEEELRDRINSDEAFSFGYLDIDNFKYFNDVYGYIKGDRAIMQTAYMLYSVIKRIGNKKDFIGHIGGDDFVFISTPQKYHAICHNFIQAFDKIMGFHYSRDDRERGFIIAKDRTGKIKNVPLMSISIAVASSGDTLNFKNIIEVNEKVAEVKRYLKTFEGSKFMEDRRNRLKDSSSAPQIYKRNNELLKSYRPIGQILLEKKLLSLEQLDDALTAHWKRGVLSGGIFKEMGLISEKDIVKALKEVNLHICA